MRICIYGAGAMGTTFGKRLKSCLKEGDECLFVARSENRITYLKEQEGLDALYPDQMEGDYDLIVLATKQRENESIARFLQSYLATNGKLLTIQNGYPEPLLAEILGDDRVFGATLTWGAELQESGEALVTSEAGYHVGLGAYGNGDTAELALLLSGAFMVTTGNLCELRFAKLSTNASFSTLSVITGLTFGEIARRYRRDAVRLIKETFAVARACGARKLPLNGHDMFRVLTRFNGALLPVAMKKYADTRSGMLLDLEKGRRCDIDYVAGAVVREGEKHGVPTPYMKRAVALVHEIENGLAEISPESVLLFREV